MNLPCLLCRRRPSFNRYMVECEYKQLRFSQKINDGFNRYMVECEYLIGGNLMGAGTSFNRYMVECELIRI